MLCARNHTLHQTMKLNQCSFFFFFFWGGGVLAKFAKKSEVLCQKMFSIKQSLVEPMAQIQKFLSSLCSYRNICNALYVYCSG